LEPSVRPAGFKPDILSFNIAKVVQPGRDGVAERNRIGLRAEDADQRRGALLRPCCKRPQRRRTERRHERAPSHSITSSARARSAWGISRPSALAVLRLITSSYLVGACTGISAGFSPLRMRSTEPPARGFCARILGP